jgi:hypothetical protein
MIKKLNLCSTDEIKTAIQIGHNVYYNDVHSEVIRQKSGTFNVTTLNKNGESYTQLQLSAVILKNGFAGFFIIKED